MNALKPGQGCLIPYRNLLFNGGPDHSRPEALPQDKSPSNPWWNEDSRRGRPRRPPTARIQPGNPQERPIGIGIFGSRRQSGSLKPPREVSRIRRDHPAPTSLNQSSADSHSLRRRRASRGLLPEPAVPQNLFDHLALAPFDEADDFHPGATFGAKQWVHLVHLFDQGRPAFPSFLGAGSRRWRASAGHSRPGFPAWETK